MAPLPNLSRINLAHAVCAPHNIYAKEHLKKEEEKKKEKKKKKLFLLFLQYTLTFIKEELKARRGGERQEESSQFPERKAQTCMSNGFVWSSGTRWWEDAAVRKILSFPA